MTEGFVNYNNANYDPNQIAQQTSSVILNVVILDTSASISSFKDIMNQTTNEVFMQELKNSHRKDDIMIQGIEFDKDVRFKSGFQPITSLDDKYLEITNLGPATALYAALLQGLKSTISYREDLEAQGIDVRTNIFLLTDGSDNQSTRQDLTELNQLITSLKTREEWIASFTISMFGVGDAGTFTQSCKDMGLDPTKCLSTVGTTAKEIREMMGVVSKSASSSNAAVTVSF